MAGNLPVTCNGNPLSSRNHDSLDSSFQITLNHVQAPDRRWVANAMANGGAYPMHNTLHSRRWSNGVTLPGFFESEVEDEAAYTEYAIHRANNNVTGTGNDYCPIALNPGSMKVSILQKNSNGKVRSDSIRKNTSKSKRRITLNSTNIGASPPANSHLR